MKTKNEKICGAEPRGCRWGSTCRPHPSSASLCLRVISKHGGTTSSSRSPPRRCALHPVSVLLGLSTSSSSSLPCLLHLLVTFSTPSPSSSWCSPAHSPHLLPLLVLSTRSPSSPPPRVPHSGIVSIVMGCIVVVWPSCYRGNIVVVGDIDIVGRCRRHWAVLTWLAVSMWSALSSLVVLTSSLVVAESPALLSNPSLHRRIFLAVGESLTISLNHLVRALRIIFDAL